MSRKKLAFVAALVVSAGVIAAAALAATGSVHYQAGLSPIRHNPIADYHSSVTGTASVDVTGTQAHVVLHIRGLTPGLPHAMHIHGDLAAKNECPGPSADTDGDGLISLAEGAPFYGPIDTSFTTTGDTSAASGLALERFPVADSNGEINYDRTFTIPQSVLDRLGSLHIVVHGLALDGNATGPVGGYDTLFEATLPVACGAISR